MTATLVLIVATPAGATSQKLHFPSMEAAQAAKNGMTAMSSFYIEAYIFEGHL